MNASDRNILTMVINSITEMHGLTVSNLHVQGSQLAFQLTGTRGSRMAWADFDGLTLGGIGLIAGTLTEALVRTCYDMTR